MLPSTPLTVSASAKSPFRGSLPLPIAAYASPWPSPNTTQHSLPGGRYPLPGPDFHRLDHASFPGAPMAGLCVPLSTLRAAPRDAPRMTRGQHDSLLLCRQGLAPFYSLPVSRRTASDLKPPRPQRSPDLPRAQMHQDRLQVEPQVPRQATDEGSRLLWRIAEAGRVGCVLTEGCVQVGL